jgi:hypothetical protein
MKAVVDKHVVDKALKAANKKLEQIMRENQDTRVRLEIVLDEYDDGRNRKDKYLPTAYGLLAIGLFLMVIALIMVRLGY